MASWVRHDPRRYIGRTVAFNYMNQDASDTSWEKTCCGQAAVLTAVATARFWPKPQVSMAEILANPRWQPDNLFGVFGSSWQCLVRILSEKFGANYKFIRGIQALRQEVASYNPVICMSDVARIDPSNTIAGHWTCVYGITDYNMMLSNWGSKAHERDAERAWPVTGACHENLCPIGDFERGWDTWLTRVGGFPSYGIAVIA